MNKNQGLDEIIRQEQGNYNSDKAGFMSTIADYVKNSNIGKAFTGIVGTISAGAFYLWLDAQNIAKAQDAGINYDTAVAGFFSPEAKGATIEEYTTPQIEPSPFKKEITINEYYNLGKPIEDNLLPEGLKVIPYNPGEGINEKTGIISNGGKAISFSKGEFSNYFNSENYGENIKEIFKSNNINPDKIANILKINSENRSVSLYREGIMVIFDSLEKKSYAFPINKNIPDKIYKL